MSHEINEANANIREIQRLRGLLDQALAELHAAERERNEAQAAADQAISNLRAIVALNDDPHIEEIANATADLLGKVLPK